ncbi:protein of unknown function [Cupriavidus neocaledonicus]|uniref:Uncharacterized protein n=1 Tax=Cupriavidus neocaledonicus TaxID=1040979 RepID=A0A375H7A2_9BURK|nr:hypothetical protein CBM2605_B100349 [Cupriavidus neocaledonicus]SPD46758.1 protein of unknown function [Cupriavidus neocaledonicus]
MSGIHSVPAGKGVNDKRAVHDEFLEAVADAGSNLLGACAVDSVARQLRNSLLLRFKALS